MSNTPMAANRRLFGSSMGTVVSVGLVVRKNEPPSVAIQVTFMHVLTVKM